MDREFERAMGQRIRQIREMRNLTQDQLSAQLQTRGCDVTRSALAKIEVGQRHIYPDEIKILKEVLRVPFETLFSE